MTVPIDPWRTLGLAPGSSLEQVRRAYRQLAKANHPDAAGEAALPRFLAIQAAYEQIVAGRRPGARPPGRARADAAEPWRADPDRARATGRADRRPGARPGSTRGPAGGSDGPASRAGTGASESPRGRAAGADRGPRRGADGDGPDGPRPAADHTRRPGAGTGRTGSAGGRAGPTGTAGSAGQEPPRGRRPSGRRRAPNKATPYSTSYDRADDEPFEPGWSGATWYGASSGTYWTINPKEYADPRKHGPEYQRRARRSATGWILDDGDADAATDTEPALDGATDERRDPPNGGDDDRRTRADNPRGRGDRVEQPSWTGGADPDPAPIRTKPPTGRAAPDDDVARGGAALEGRDRPAAPLPPRAGGATLPMPTTPAGRLAFALLGWPPIGLALAAAIGEETGCGRFAASCDALAGPGTWVVQAAIVVLLLAIPSVARWSAHGTLATLIAGVPVAAVLSAGGGSRQPDASAAALGVVLALAYVVGVGYAVWMSRRSRTVAPDAGRDADRDTPGGDAP